MSPERPEAECFKVRLVKTTQKFRNGVEVHFADWMLYQVNKKSSVGIHYRIAWFSTTCKSNLHKFLTGLLLNWDWKRAGDIDVTPEQAKYLEIIFNNGKEYNYWKQGLYILSKDGKDAAWEWLKEILPLLKLRNKLAG